MGWRRAAVAALLGLVAPIGVAQPERTLGADQRATSAPVSTQELVRRCWPGVRFDAEIPTPEEIIGVAPGERFVRHHEVIEYATRLAEVSDRLTLESYGKSYQDRPLVVVVATAPANHERMDEILQLNRALTDPSSSLHEEIIEDNPAIAWLSMGVHGNELGPTEAAVRLLYALAAAQGATSEKILSEVVTVIDPCLNPDGRQRYLGWYEQANGRVPDPNAWSSEHWEPWPGGRTNHYCFDLNRDWVWGTQVESAQRLPIYRRFMPQLHIDAHEQGYESPFFFGEGDTPYHANIPESTREWVKVYGEANAAMFDRRGWVYSTAERFDYLYPGYGKVLPCYHGAVGMLTEAAGHSRGGLAIDVFDHYTWTILDRMERHLAISLDYIHTTAERRRGQLERFRSYFADSVDRGRNEPLTVVISSENDPALLREVWALCALHGIEVSRTTRATPARTLTSYETGERATSGDAPAGSWVISARQPMGLLVRTLFARDAELEDADTYDITGWSVPPVFGLEAWYTESRFAGTVEALGEWAPPSAGLEGDGSTALIVEGGSIDSGRAVAAAIRHGLHTRIAREAIEVEGRSFGAGSVIVPLGRNETASVDAFIAEIEAIGLPAVRTDSGLTASGPVLGANAHGVLRPKPVAIVRGEPMGSNSYGQHWWLLDRVLEMPHSQINAEHLARAPLDGFGAVVLASGGALDDDARASLDDWVRGGGVLVATGSSAFGVSRDLLDLERDDEVDEPADDDRPVLSELNYEQRRARSVEDRVPGALVGIETDVTHPLAAGAPAWCGVVIRSARSLPVADGGHVLARFSEAPVIAGHISERHAASIAGKPFATLHRHGRGWVFCVAHDVTLRGFEIGPRRLLLNAITIGPAF
ncbi:MAG: M14 family metallopeptidase [Planctomycetota bacterium]